MHYSITDLQSVFDPITLARGRDYQARGKVESVKANMDGDLISALVKGSGNQSYRSIIKLSLGPRKELQVRGQCACPMVYNCKHVAAVLLELVAEQKLEARPAAASDYFVNDWLQRITRAANPAGSYPDNVKDRMLYVLQLSGQPLARLEVRLYKTRLLKDGGYGQNTNFSGNLHSTANFLLPADTGIMRQFAANRIHSSDISMRESWGANLLREIIETGRAHWQGTDSPALRLAEPRTAPLVWREEEAGRQRLSVDAGAGVLVLPLSPPWFMDTERHCCGPLVTGIDDAMAGALITGPVMEAAQAEALVPRLAHLVPAASLPQPKHIEVREISDLKPVPHLVLGSLQLPQPDYLRARWKGNFDWEDYATLRFGYGEAEIDASEPGDTVKRRSGDEFLIIARDHNAERHAVAALVRLGFAPLVTQGLPRSSFVHLQGKQGWLNFTLSGIAELQQLGWSVEMQPSFRFHLVEPEEWHAEIEEGGDWFDLGMGIEVEGKRVELLPLLAGLIREMPADFDLTDLATEDNESILVHLDGQRLLRLPMARVRPILATLAELFDPGALDQQGRLRLSRLASPQLLDLAPDGPLQWAGGEKLRAFAERLKDFSGIKKARLPKDFKAKLRPYQQEGLNWLQFLREYGLGGILADDMGLGKTVQALAHLLLEKQSGRMDKPSMVIAPTSLIHNWRREAQQFAPSLKVLVLHGTERKARFEAIAEHDLVLTTYPLLARDEEALLAQSYHLLILDEAQMIKNPRAKATEIARAIPARHRLCLTGTPMENHLGELWSLFHFLMPGLLGDERRFKRLYRNPIEKEGDEPRRKLLAQRVKPFLLRRTKAQVAKELPQKTEIIRSVSLEGAQRDLYETVRAAMHQRVREEVEKKGLDRSRIIILDALLKLRQCCCDPRLLKLDAAKKVKQSAKLELLMTMLPEMVEEGRRILLFSQFTSMLELIEAELAARKLAYVKLTGQTRDRATPVDQFQAGQVPIFLISLKAGGTGLNLTAADTVIHYDPWWNPAVEAQATDRAYRIGQDKPVFVYKLLTEHTVEEKIAALQAHKKELAEALLGEGGGKLKLSQADLAQLFEPVG
jgi:superfamily II DNA or RNA helicase